MGSPYEEHYVDENKHCLVCHQENATVIHHPVGDVKAGDFGHIEVICNNKECKAELMIPRLTDPTKMKKGHNETKTASW
jgi:hypothetical protein